MLRFARRVNSSGPWRARVAPFLIGAALVLAACGGASETPTPAATTPPDSASTATETPAVTTTEATAASTTPTTEAAASPTATSAPATTAPSGDDSDSAEAWLMSMAPVVTDVKSYRMTMTMDLGIEGGVQEMHAEFVRPDRMRITTTTPEGDAVMTFVDGTMYMTIGGMSFNQPASAGQIEEMMPTDLDDISEDWAPAGATYSMGGTETVDGVECQVVTISWEEDGEKFTSTYWIGVKDRLPRKMVTEIEVSASDDNDAHVSTIEGRFYDYNADIVIEAPE